jgi:hypothetical protein
MNLNRVLVGSSAIIIEVFYSDCPSKCRFITFKRSLPVSCKKSLPTYHYHLPISYHKLCCWISVVPNIRLNPISQQLLLQTEQLQRNPAWWKASCKEYIRIWTVLEIHTTWELNTYNRRHKTAYTSISLNDFSYSLRNRKDSQIAENSLYTRITLYNTDNGPACFSKRIITALENTRVRIVKKKLTVSGIMDRLDCFLHLG